MAKGKEQSETHRTVNEEGTSQEYYEMSSSAKSYAPSYTAR